MDKWLPISKAPKDGTMILVTETRNGEAWNVIPACWMALTSQEQSDKEFFENGGLPPNNSHKGSWWGICATRWSREGPLYTRFKPLACTPVCWMHFPEMESETKLNRRMSQLYRN